MSRLSCLNVLLACNIFSALLFVLPVDANAQETIRADQKYLEAIKKSSGVTPVAIDSFGDNIDLSNGGGHFRWTDIDIAGNNALPVRLQRSLTIEDKVRGGGGDLGGFGPAGDLDIPYLKGIFPTSGWQNNGSSPNARCTMPSAPPSAASGTIYASDYWSGNWLHIPWEGEQAMLSDPAASLPKPAGGAAIMTKSFWAFTCLPSTANGYPGEGFIAISPKGEKYYFNWVVSKMYPGFSKRYGNYGRSTATMSRQSVYFLVTRIEDRFGNWVTYDYVGSKLNRIEASDGRFIQITAWNGNDIASVSSSVGNWNYAYTPNSLVTTQPDGSHWTYASTGLLEIEPTPSLPLYDSSNRCPAPELSTGSYSLAVTQPSGATATFQFDVMRHHKNNIPELCNSFTDESLQSYKYLTIPDFSDSFTLVSKAITGLGLPNMQWTYSYAGAGGPLAFEEFCSDPANIGCPPTKTTTVRGPNRSYKRYAFGNLYKINSGQLITLEEGYETGVAPNVQPVIMKSTTNTYMSAAELGTQPFPDRVGSPGSSRFDDVEMASLRPLKLTEIVQDAATFSSAANSFDVFARPLNVTKFSSIESRTRPEQIAYSDNLGKWVLGQVKSVSSSGYVVSKTDYDPTWAVPTKIYSFGKPLQTFGFNFATGNDQAGTLATVTDGNLKTTTLSSWKRGIPQTITYPPTPERPSGAIERASVDDEGQITWVEDENAYRTCYGYDAMGRINKITYPSETQLNACDALGAKWNPTTITFDDGYPGAYGVPAGHWRQTTLTGNGRKVLIFDALWRPIVEQSLDLANVSGTTSEVIKRYDASGRVAFQSYPMNTNGQAIYSDTGLKGTDTTYDALDRVTRVEQDNEISASPLVTTTTYLPGFKTQVINPRNYTTTTSYMAFDRPTYDWPVALVQPEGAYVDIDRNIFGKPELLTRRNADSSLAITRGMIYDSNMQPCKTVEPETGLSVMTFDAAGNLSWTASAQPLNTADCTDVSSVPVNSRVTRTYDARNRVKSLNFPDGLGTASYTYAPDGVLATITADNGGADQVTTSYGYNRRRMLAAERLQVGAVDWTLGYDYNSNGHLSSQTYPAGLNVDYLPNALGQPTQAGSYATGVSYYPNGAMKQFIYGNGIVHTLLQNTRGLPDRSTDAYGATAVLDDSYDYDANGNVAAISDGLLGNSGDRDMTYDGLDRLTKTLSPMFGAAGANYTYDVLDNLTHVIAPSRNHYYCYDASWRLTNVKTTSCSGASVIGLGYDARGNLAYKNGVSYTFDLGNRLRSVSPVSTYIYDGQGRRVRDVTSAAKFSMYSSAGQLVYADDQRASIRSNYIYLNGSLVARDTNVPAVNAPVLTAPANSATGTYTVQWTTSAQANRYELQEQANGGAWIQIYSGPATSIGRSAKPNGIYGYQARACIDAACYAWSAVATVVVSTAPTTAPALTVPSTGPNGSYTVTWTSISGATSYWLEESANGGSWISAYTGIALSKAFTVKPAGSYNYRVSACNASGCGAVSSPGTVQVVYPPAAAPALTVPATSYTGSYTVSWTSVSSASSYTLEESANGGAWLSSYSGSVLSKAVTGKGNGGFAYRVKACNAIGCSAVSVAKTVQVTLPPVSAPVLSTPSANQTGSYTVSWGAVAGATSYTLDESLNGAAWITAYTGTALSKAMAGKAQGTYAYRVKACNAAGCGPVSVSKTTVVDFKPATPTLTAPSVSTTLSFTISWNSVATATSYRLETNSGGATWTVLYTGTALSFARSQPNYTTYGYRISACNANGCSAYSPTKNVTVERDSGCTTCLMTPPPDETSSITPVKNGNSA